MPRLSASARAPGMRGTARSSSGELRIRPRRDPRSGAAGGTVESTTSEKPHAHTHRHQRLRPHRPRRGARRRRVRRRPRDRRRQRRRRRRDARPPARVRLDLRPLPGRRARRGRLPATPAACEIRALAERDPAELPWDDLERRRRDRGDRQVPHPRRRRQAPRGRRAQGDPVRADEGRRARRREHRARRQRRRSTTPSATTSSPTPRARPTASRRSPRCCTRRSASGTA